jgi:hypothetical protein
MLKIDFDHYQGAAIADMTQQNLNEERMLTIIEKLKPDFKVDGNQFVYILGELQDKNCIVRFGINPYEAMVGFCNNFYGAKL